MQVKTQPFKEALEIKSDGICFDVYGNGAKRLGDLAVTKAGLVWNKTAGGKPLRNQGINVRWEEFINWVQSRRAAAGNGVVKLSPSAGKPQGKSVAKAAAKTVSPAQKLGAKDASSAAVKPASVKPVAGKPVSVKPASAKTVSVKPASSLKAGAGKTVPALKIPAKTLPTLKVASKLATPVKPFAKAAPAIKLAAKPASSAKPSQGNGVARFSQQNGTPVKLPVTKLPQTSKAKGKVAPAAKKSVSAAVATAARRKAN